MNPSERIKIITEISKSLSVSDWPLIDLTLDQFGFQIIDDWRGEKEGYVIEIIKSASDEILNYLAKHLRVVLQDNSVDELHINSIQKDNFTLFLSHVTTHKDLATKLQQGLSEFDISAFVAHIDIEPTKEWLTEIEVALNTSDALVALMTPNFHESKWTDQEIGIAMGEGLLVIPVRLGMDPYGFIGKYQGLQGLNKTHIQITKEIVNILIKNKKTQGKLLHILVSKFIESSSFKEAKDLIGIIEEAGYIDEMLISKMVQAANDNDQIKYSFGVSSRIEALAKKFTMKKIL